MPSTTITISTEAHEILSRLKQGKESFSDVILRHVRLPADTLPTCWSGSKNRLPRRSIPPCSTPFVRRGAVAPRARPPLISRDAAFDRVRGLRRFAY